MDKPPSYLVYPLLATIHWSSVFNTVEALLVPVDGFNLLNKPTVHTSTDMLGHNRSSLSPFSSSSDPPLCDPPLSPPHLTSLSPSKLSTPLVNTINFAQANQLLHSQDVDTLQHDDDVLYSTPKKATTTTLTPTLTPSRNAAALARKAFILASQDILTPLKLSNGSDGTSRQLLVNNNIPLFDAAISTSTGKHLAVAWYVKKKDDKAMIKKNKGRNNVDGYNKKSNKYCYESCKEN